MPYHCEQPHYTDTTTGTSDGYSHVAVGEATAIPNSSLAPYPARPVPYYT